MAASAEGRTERKVPSNGAFLQTFVICHLDAFRFAIPAVDVREIHPAVAVTPLAGAPEAIGGVVDVRGTLVPVLDLRSRLGLEPRELTPSDVFVRVSLEDRELLLLVDHVSDVERISAAARERSEELVPGARYIREVGRDQHGPIVVHDLDTFLSADELVDLDAALDELERSSGSQS